MIVSIIIACDQIGTVGIFKTAKGCAGIVVAG